MTAGRLEDGPTIRLGVPVGPFEGRVDADAAVAYALATNDPNPACREGTVVPPLYTVSVVMGSFERGQQECIDPGAIVEGRGMVHAEHDMFFHAPIKPEMPLRWTIEAHAVRQTRAGVLFTWRFLIDDGQGQLLVEHLWSSMHVAATTAALGGPDLPDHAYPQAARRRIFATERFELARDQTYRYAGVSGDRAPHALDDEAARREGFPSKIVQGTCILAMAAGAAVQRAGGGDPLALRRLAVRFAAPAFPKRQLEVELADAGAASGGGRAVVFEARQGATVCLRNGRAEFA